MPSRANRIIPAIVMTAAAAVPIGTAVEIVTHVNTPHLVGITAAAPVASATPSPVAVAPKAVHRTRAKRPTATPTDVPVARTYSGTAIQDQYGIVQAVLTVQGERITAVSISAPRDDQRSASINSYAVPLLVSETLQAQSANINLVSGATDTSDAYVQSLQSAVKKATSARAL